MEWYVIPAVILVGLVAGFINTLAGSGSLLTLPLLMFLGLPPNVANGTNRIAILLQNVVAVSSFKKQGVLKLGDGLWIGVAAILGSLLGANVAVTFNEVAMRYAIAILLMIMVLLLIFKPERWIYNKQSDDKPKNKTVQFIVFFVVGIYGGFIQAGVGFFLLAGLILTTNYDLVRSNALKVLIVLIYTPFALFVFIMNNQVDYKLGLLLSLGNMTGAYIATRLAVKKGVVFVRFFLILALIFASLKLLGLF